MAKKSSYHSEILKIEQEINKIFEDIFSKNEKHFFLEEGWVPFVDICERENEVLVKVELPGVAKRDIKIFLSGDRLEIKGTKREPARTSNMRFLRLEREYGKFHRVLSLPYEVNPKKAKAFLNNGVLTIKLDKLVGGKEKEVEIIVE
ncbi:MAG: Hsp20/alpha crystallin family protein [Candidatus Aminicenantia bacterium]